MQLTATRTTLELARIQSLLEPLSRNARLALDKILRNPLENQFASSAAAFRTDIDHPIGAGADIQSEPIGCRSFKRLLFFFVDRHACETAFMEV